MVDNTTTYCVVAYSYVGVFANGNRCRVAPSRNPCYPNGAHGTTTLVSVNPNCDGNTNGTVDGVYDPVCKVRTPYKVRLVVATRDSGRGVLYTHTDHTGPTP